MACNSFTDKEQIDIENFLSRFNIMTSYFNELQIFIIIIISIKE